MDSVRHNMNETWEDLHKEGGISKLLSSFPKKLPISSGSNLLDIGCGEGFQLSWLCNKYDVDGWGIDVSEYAIQESKKYTNIQTKIGSAENIPFPDGMFDFVYSLGLFEHFAEVGPLFREANRVTKIGGIVLITVPNYVSLWTLLLRPLLRIKGEFKIDIEKSFNTKGLTELFVSNGFMPPRFYSILFDYNERDDLRKTLACRIDNGVSKLISHWAFFLGAVARKKSNLI